MKNKVCVCCKQLKDINEFHKNKSKKDGIQDTCKICRKLKSFENNEKLKIYRHEWYQKNKENVIKKVNLKYHHNKNEINDKRKEKYRNNNEYRDKIRGQHKEYYNENKELFYKNSKKWVEKNKEKRNQISKKHYNKHITLMICRRLIKRTIKYFGTKKELTTIEILGYSPISLKENIESKFTDGMTWENYGEWHIDHIRPISSFNKNELPSVVNSLNNLQPLWAFDNLSKGNKFKEY
jgi:hypothetical protein